MDLECASWISPADRWARRISRWAIVTGAIAAAVYIALSFYYSSGWDALVLWVFASAQLWLVFGGLIFGALFAFPGLGPWAKPWARVIGFTFFVLWGLSAVVTLVGPPTLITAALVG